MLIRLLISWFYSKTNSLASFIKYLWNLKSEKTAGEKRNYSGPLKLKEKNDVASIKRNQTYCASISSLSSDTKASLKAKRIALISILCYRRFNICFQESQLGHNLQNSQSIGSGFEKFDKIKTLPAFPAWKYCQRLDVILKTIDHSFDTMFLLHDWLEHEQDPEILSQKSRRSKLGFSEIVWEGLPVAQYFYDFCFEVLLSFPPAFVTITLKSYKNRCWKPKRTQRFY